MLDIGIVIPQLVKYGGAERLLIECLARWQDKHTLTVYATEFNSAVLREHGVGGGVTLKKLSPQITDNAFSFLLNATFTPKRWKAEIGLHDIYHTHLWPMHLLDLAPCVWYPHEPLRILHDLRTNLDVSSVSTEKERQVHIYPKFSYDTVRTNLFEPMFSAVDIFDKTSMPYRIIANSRYCAGYIEQVYGYKANRVVYPGVTADDFLPSMASEYLLTVSQLWPHKRIGLIIESLRLLDDIQLYIVGSGPEKENLERMARQLGVYDHTFFLSGLSTHDLQIVFSRALAVVFTPVREPFGIVALEAMAASKPLIAVNEGGYTEVVDADSAFLIPPYVDELAKKVTFLRRNPDIAESMGRHGHELAKQYTWDRTAAQLLEEIENAHADWRKEHAISLESAQAGPLFGAQYYGWYGNGLGSSHWNDNRNTGSVTEMPVLGYYSSNNSTVLEQHLSMAADMGLDFFCFNLHVDARGVSEEEYSALKMLLAQTEAMRSPVRICVQLCCYASLEADLCNLLLILRHEIFTSANYLTHGGNPVLAFFWTGQHDADRPFLNLLRGQARDTVLIASSLRLYDQQTESTLTQGTFDGWSLFSPLELAAQEKWESIWAGAYANHQAGSLGLRCLTVSPGYDDRALDDQNRQGNPYRHVPRSDGATYRRMLNFALKEREAPDFIFISTFNELHENTHIEPTVESGSRYLDLTRDFIQQGRAQWKK